MVDRIPRTLIRKGIGLESPNFGSNCKVKLKIFSQDDIVKLAIEKEIVIGEECMHTNEVCVIPCDNGNLEKEFAISTEVDLWCEIELLSFFKAKEPWQSTSEEKLTIARHHKTKGTDCYKQLILIGDKLPNECQDDFEQLRVSCLLNLAACQGKLEQFEFVAQNCTKVLAMVPSNLKALYRRGQAFAHLNEFDKAKVDLEKALAVDPCNRAVQEQLRALKQKQSLHEQKLSRALGVMFGRKTSLK
ncbi:Peptidyl-prolyl cis-trans isomerase FKBP62 [Acropora cervicornis]|uniref:Peptidyl-prolyl cis-trans isomerase FKBP62 n=1 Tax=Acropora cervicornis TaxID=6130 RepID=A0AAD9QPP0_ACRCE|nr:Peptidyl-prolyl cis-trans isomerase FKBP62 [Acropora cervicornis]